MAKRMKSTAFPAITSLDELVARVGRFGALSAEIETHIARANEQIAAIKASLAAATEPMAAEMKAIHAAAKPWWAANGEQLTDGKKKSVELAGCLIGERLSKPALAHPKPEDVAIELIKGHQWPGLLRVKEELDKPAIMKALAFATDNETTFESLEAAAEGVDVRDTLLALGFSISQKEEFFIARQADPAQPTETVADPAEQVAA
jgi:phage host-nuclease inhibitor protein Gam